jgi:hypothetical protein
MALVVKDRIKETSTTAGTGTLTLAGAASGFRSFADVGNGNTTYYAIVDSTAGTWEVGIGTYTSSGTTLSRNTVLSNSSGTTSKISFAANSKDVFVTYPSEKAVYVDGAAVVSNNGEAAVFVNSQTMASNTTIPAGSSGISVGPFTVNSGVVFTVASGARHVVI